MCKLCSYANYVTPCFIKVINLVPSISVGIKIYVIIKPFDCILSTTAFFISFPYKVAITIINSKFAYSISFKRLY